MVRSPRTARNRIPWVVVAVVGLFLAIVIRGQYVDYYVESLVDESYERSDYQGLETPSGILTLKPTLPAKSTPTPITPTVAEKPPVALPLKVPFTSQAPLTIWDPLHEEACEEASLLMVYYYRTGQKFVSPLEADTEIKKLVAWEEQNGYKVDLTAKELVAVASGYMKLKTGRVIVDPTVDQLKAELKAGRPVIVPAAGRELRNPYFTAPGPIYHMLVLKGYDETAFKAPNSSLQANNLEIKETSGFFIVNDPGTRRGENYHYGFKPIMDAMHDWNPDNILNGQKAVVVFD